MRDPTGLLQAQARVVHDAAAWLNSFHPHAEASPLLTEQIVRVFIARLTGAPIHAEMLRALRRDFSAALRAQTIDAVTSALRAHHLTDDDLQEHVRAVRGLVIPERPAGDSDLRPEHAEPQIQFPSSRPSLIDALNDVGPVSVEAELAIRLSAVLRVRALNADASCALIAAAQNTGFSNQVHALPSAHDELLLAALRPLAQGVPDLVRAAQALLTELGPETSGGVVLGLAATETGSAQATADDEGYLRTLHRAADLARTGGLIALDEQSFLSSEDELAEHPQKKFHVDPHAAFGHDRWELSSLLNRPPFQGREQEISTLADDLVPEAIANASSSAAEPARAKLIFLHGPQGIGKTSLLRQALKRAQLRDETAPVLWGAADTIQPTPYAPIVGMLRALAGAPPGADHARARLTILLEGLVPFLDPTDRIELLGLESILSYLIGAGDDGDDEELAAEVDSLSPRALRVAIRRALLLVVRALSKRGQGRAAVLVVPGADAVDLPTRELLAFLARRLGSRAVVVLISATKLRLPKRFTEGFDVRTLSVAPLSTSQSSALIAQVLGDDIADQKIEGQKIEGQKIEGQKIEGQKIAGKQNAGQKIAGLVEKAKGSPLALHHLARFGVEGGLIKREGGSWDLTDVKVRKLPGSIDRILQGRIERLPTAQRRTLSFCAVLGHTFLPAAVEIVGVRRGLAREEIGRALELLLQTGFLLRSGHRPGAPVFPDAAGPPPGPVLAFEHPLLRAAAEAATPADEQAELHALAAEAVETLLPSGTRAVAAALARHLTLAGDREGAIKYLALAAKRAVRLNNTAGALQMAEEGLALCLPHEPGLLFSFQLALEKALEQAGERERQKLALKNLVRFAEQTGEQRRQGQALSRVARFNVFSGDHAKAEQVALRALERFRFAKDDTGQAQALRLIALARFERRNLEGALDALSVAREHVPYDDRRSLGIVEHQLGMMRLEAGDAVGAVEHLVAAREHKRRTGDLAGEGAVLDGLADAFVRAGRLHVAHEVLLRTIELRERIGDEAGRADSSKNLAEVALMCGDLTTAKDLAQRARQLAKQLGLERLERSATTLAARCALSAGDAKSAEQLIDTVRRRTDESRDPFTFMQATLVSAQAKWARAIVAEGKPAKERLLKTALARARAASTLGEDYGYATGQVLGAALIGAVLFELGDVSGALLYSQRAFEMIDDRSSTALPVEDVVAGHARILDKLGDAEDAARVRERAYDILQTRAGRLPEEARARFWAPPARAALRSSQAGV